MSLDVGSDHACVVLENATVRCWGFNLFLQVGSADGGSRITSAVTVPSFDGVLSISSGGADTCGTTAGGLWCWGDNVHGSLGQGSTTPDSSAAPVRVNF